MTEEKLYDTLKHNRLIFNQNEEKLGIIENNRAQSVQIDNPSFRLKIPLQKHTKTMETNEKAILIEDEKLTSEKLKFYPGCDSYSDDQALNVIQSIEKLAIILFDFTCQKHGIIIDNQLVIPLNEEKITQNKAA